MQKAKPKHTLLFTVVFLVIGVGVIIAFNATKPAGEQVHGESLAYHHHAMLEYYLDGQKQVVPANIGIGIDNGLGPAGMYPVHTHDASGTIHLESKSADLRLSFAEFVELWGLDLSDKRYSLFVNGALVDYDEYYFNDRDMLRFEVVS